MIYSSTTLEFPDPERMELLDDCMSFPGLLVKVERYRRCTVRCRDLDWRECRFTFEAFNVFGGVWEENTPPHLPALPRKGDTMVGNDVWFARPSGRHPCDHACGRQKVAVF